jgi:hypothetical protein
LTLRIEFEREVDGRWIAEIGEIPGVLCNSGTREEATAKARALAFDLGKFPGQNQPRCTRKMFGRNIDTRATNDAIRPVSEV